MPPAVVTAGGTLYTHRRTSAGQGRRKTSPQRDCIIPQFGRVRNRDMGLFFGLPTSNTPILWRVHGYRPSASSSNSSSGHHIRNSYELTLICRCSPVLGSIASLEYVNFRVCRRTYKPKSAIQINTNTTAIIILSTISPPILNCPHLVEQSFKLFSFNLSSIPVSEKPVCVRMLCNKSTQFVFANAKIQCCLLDG